MRTDLATARADRDVRRIVALRSALTALDTAPPPDTDAQIRDLITAEIDQRLTAADSVRAKGEHMRAGTLRAEAEVLSDLLGRAA